MAAERRAAGGRSEEEVLPAGWTSSVDAASGATYYTAPSGLTQWEAPAAPADDALPEGWAAEVDANGATYFKPTRRGGAAQWERPTAPPPL